MGQASFTSCPGATGSADMMRIMDPTPQYPQGYVRHYNNRGQPLDPSGKPGDRASTHIPLDYEGPISGWPQYISKISL